MTKPTDAPVEPFLSRWSRRARAEDGSPDLSATDGEPEALLKTSPVATHDAAPSEMTEAEALEAFDLPDPDSLSQGSDFTGFMREGVPAALRRRALRKLWLTDPALANLDELVDYGGDFTDAGLGAGVVETAYKVGQGFIDRAKEALGEDETDGDLESADLEVVEQPTDAEKPDLPEQDETEAVRIAPPTAQAPRARMVFHEQTAASETSKG